jgi:hypothetical protein
MNSVTSTIRRAACGGQSYNNGMQLTALRAAVYADTLGDAPRFLLGWVQSRAADSLTAER